jgi:hypothetical protein
MMQLRRERMIEITGERRKRKREAKTRIANLVRGTTQSDYATVEQIRPNFLQSIANSETLANVPMI